MWVCVWCVCVYIFDLHMSVSMYTQNDCMCVCECMCLFLSKCVFVFECICLSVYVCVCVCVCVWTCVCVGMCVEVGSPQQGHTNTEALESGIHYGGAEKGEAALGCTS